MKKTLTKGLELLHQRMDFENIDFEDLGFLPPIMRLFHYYFDIGREDDIWENLKEDFGFVESQLNNFAAGWYVKRMKWFEHLNGEEYDNTVCSILDYKEIEKQLEDYSKGVREIDEPGFVRIGYMCAYGDWIMMDAENHHNEAIYNYGSSFDLEFISMAENIFDFFAMIEQYWIDEEKLTFFTNDLVSLKDMYRAWGETDWRVRGFVQGEAKYSEDMLLKRGLGLLRQREISSEQLESLLAKLPFRASVFYKYYNTGTYEDLFNFMLYQFKLSDGSAGLVIEDRWFEDEPEFNQRFGRLLTIEELNVEFEKYNDKKEEYNKKGFVLIGEMEDATKKMLMSIEGNNIEEIWIYDDNGEYRKISNDIFHFFTKVNRYWSDKDIVKATNGAKTGKDLYENWGENFWRVTE